jgi:hypothetical protein
VVIEVVPLALVSDSCAPQKVLYAHGSAKK